MEEKQRIIDKLEQEKKNLKEKSERLNLILSENIKNGENIQSSVFIIYFYIFFFLYFLFFFSPQDVLTQPANYE
jgi:hypothetical protein